MAGTGNPLWVKGGPSPNPNGARGNKTEAIRRAENMLEELAPAAVAKLAELMERGDVKTQAYAAQTILRYTMYEKKAPSNTVVDAEVELPIEELKRLASG